MEFFKVAQTSDIERGSMKLVQVGIEHVAIVNDGGSFYAVGGVCPHFQCYLADGWLEDGVITCSCHGAAFDVKSGKGLNYLGANGILTYEVKVEGDAILVGNARLAKP